jgi:hypothetical protein
MEVVVILQLVRGIAAELVPNLLREAVEFLMLTHVELRKKINHFVCRGFKVAVFSVLSLAIG